MASETDPTRGLTCYLVGGAVRDRRLGLEVKERDFVVVGAQVETMLERGFLLVGKDFPVFLHPRTHEEYALARTERKVAPGYRGFSVHAADDVTLEQDLQRRDLTINALAEDNEGRLIDPYGGQQDLEARWLRHVSPAFREDPVRVLRVARFAARFAHLGFRLAPETLELMREMSASGELDALVPERVWQELASALATRTPSRFFTTLRSAGALAHLFPEIDRLWGVPQEALFHPEIDTGLHAMLVLDAAAAMSDQPEIRFAALTHDLGKGVTPPAQWPDHSGHEARGLPLVEDLCRRWRAPRRFRDLALLATGYHGRVHRLGRPDAVEALELMQETDAFRRPERFRELLLICEADSRGRHGFEQQPYPQRASLEAALTAAKTADRSPLPRDLTDPGEIQSFIRARRLAAIEQVVGE